MCAVFEVAIRAVVDGFLPTLFQAPATDDELSAILDDIILEPKGFNESVRDNDLPLVVGGQDILIEIVRNAEEHTSFTIDGYSFPEEMLFGPTTNSEIAFGRAEEWLDQCLKTHICTSSKFGGPPPTRLLDIRGDQVTLLETNGLTCPYVCLSHRWGDATHRQLVSTVRTIKNHMRGIPWGDIPKTFQDAVTITRRMKVDYLWIDSLCILQSFTGMTKAEAEATDTDFAKENALMANIYMNSHFTISADISTSMDSGIFTLQPTQTCKLEVIDDEGKPARLYIRGVTSHYHLPTELETRGWTLQESVLPARVMHFGEFEISWRCRESQTCECGHPRGALESLGLLSTASQLITGGDIRLFWDSVVHNYACRLLTNEKDKLPALSGLAQVYQQTTKHTYLAGLWQQSLARDLCWYHVQNPFGHPKIFSVGHRTEKYRVPSWSWASIDFSMDAYCCWWAPNLRILSPVSIKAEQRSICTVHRAVCQPRSIFDPTGAVEYGHIELSGTLISATIHVNPREGTPWTIINVPVGTQVTRCIPDCELEGEGLTIGDEVYCMAVQEVSMQHTVERGCLVLKCGLGERSATYRRIGFCILTTWSGKHDQVQTSMGPLYISRRHRNIESRIMIL